MSLLHATCVAIDGRGVLLRGPSGVGKSDLALRLLDDGAVLVGDDYCAVDAVNGGLVAKAAPNIAGKLEVRGYGIVDFPATSSALIALVVDLMRAQDIPRLPETTHCIIDGVTVAWTCIDPTTASAAARVRLAVKRLGENRS
jgi:serine kinase of HPr protein (carbohydrate metabolism regulator)